MVESNFAVSSRKSMDQNRAVERVVEDRAAVWNVEVQAEGGKAKCGANNRKEPDGERRTFLFAVQEGKGGASSVNQSGMEFHRANVTGSPRRLSVSRFH